MSYITTFSGIHFDPVNPRDELIQISDIAHALAMICRANGHTRIFYSVAQHSIACAREAEHRGRSKEVVLGCLLHDGSEAYLSDVTRPVKKDLDYYLKVEDHLQNMIWEHFIGRPVTADEKQQIFEIDDEMLSMEFHQLMPEDISGDYRRLTRAIDCRLEQPEKVANEFTGLLKQYIS